MATQHIIIHIKRGNKMKKQKFTEPNLKLMELDLNDVITSSVKVELPDEDWEE